MCCSSMRWGKFFGLILLGYLSFMPAAQANEPAVDGGTGEHPAKKELNVSELLFDHILDAHDWHILDIPNGTDANGEPRYTPVSIPLPYILYTSEKGFDVFLAPHHAGGHGEHHDPLAEHGYKTEGRNIVTMSGASVVDISITKTVVQIFIICILLFLVFMSVAGAYTRRAGQAPKGMQGFFEPLIVFVRDDIAVPNLHGKHARFVPYLLTLFFFIFFSNLMGLTPLNSNIAGNISVTVALALLTFIIVQFNGSKDYWVHIFWTPGVPMFLRVIMLPVEIIGVFTKPFSLTIRLFANITAGHFMVLALVSLIFILGENGTNAGAAFTIAPLSVAFGIFIFSLELLVALVQAYIFTLLTAVFLGMAMESHEHAHDEAHAHH